MTDDMQSQLERWIGRKLPPEEAGTISDLNRMPAALIEEARKHGSLVGGMLLAHYVTVKNLPYLNGFIEQVVEGGKPVETWRRGAVIVPETSLEDQLTLSLEEMLGWIGGPTDMRLVPRYSAWKGGSSEGGAPARELPDRTYLSPHIPKVVSFSAGAKIEKISNLPVAMRRWIAARIASCMKGDGVPQTVSELFNRLPDQPPMDQWSEDARIAAAAVVREFHEFGAAAEGAIPGFRGPDEYYQASSK